MNEQQKIVDAIYYRLSNHWDGPPTTEEIKAAAELIDQLRQRLAELETKLATATETWTDEAGNAWSPPTAWAYAQSCRVREELRAKLAQAEQDASRWRKARGLSLEHMTCIFNPGWCRDGQTVMEKRDQAIDAAIASQQCEAQT